MPSPRRIASTRWPFVPARAPITGSSARFSHAKSPTRNPAPLIARLADPATRIVSLTVTEKGYCHTPQTGDLDERHPDIVHDLQNPGTPRSAIGFLVAALARRRIAGAAPFTVLSCDNLSANGHTVRADRDAVRRACDRAISPNGSKPRWPSPRPWWTGSCRRPPTLDRAAVSSALGMTDAWPVVTEPFTQWIVEDRFPAGRPDFAAAGVQMVSDVTPFEHMKLRLLNASHSALAYLGYLAGHETIASTMTDDRFARVRPTGDGRRRADADDACGHRSRRLQRVAAAALRQSRSASPHLADRDGRLAETAAAAARHHRRTGCGWACRSTRMRSRWRAGCATSPQRTNRDAPIDVRDPLAPEACCDRRGAPARSRSGLRPRCWRCDSIFGALGSDPRMRSAVTAALAKLYEMGARRVVQEFRPA